MKPQIIDNHKFALSLYWVFGSNFIVVYSGLSLKTPWKTEFQFFKTPWEMAKMVLESPWKRSSEIRGHPVLAKLRFEFWRNPDVGFNETQIRVSNKRRENCRKQYGELALLLFTNISGRLEICVFIRDRVKWYTTTSYRANYWTKWTRFFLACSFHGLYMLSVWLPGMLVHFCH